MLKVFTSSKKKYLKLYIYKIGVYKSLRAT